jgi:hypothetical protein
VEGQRAQHRCIDRAEHRGRCADAEGEDADDRDGECGSLGEPAHGVAEVLPEAVEGTESPHVATPLVKAGLVAEAFAGGEVGVVRIGPGASERFLAQLQVESHLLGELGAELVAAEEVAESAKE